MDVADNATHSRSFVAASLISCWNRTLRDQLMARIASSSSSQTSCIRTAIRARGGGNSDGSGIPANGFGIRSSGSGSGGCGHSRGACGGGPVGGNSDVPKTRGDPIVDLEVEGDLPMQRIADPLGV
jgi:hypothetical protein